MQGKERIEVERWAHLEVFGGCYGQCKLLHQHDNADVQQEGDSGEKLVQISWKGSRKGKTALAGILSLGIPKRAWPQPSQPRP